MESRPKKLLDRVREVIQRKHYSNLNVHHTSKWGEAAASRERQTRCGETCDALPKCVARGALAGALIGSNRWLGGSSPFLTA